MEIRKGMYALPQAGILANQLLKKRTAKYRYDKFPHIPGVWKHCSQPILLTLVIDIFGMINAKDRSTKRLLSALKEY